MFYVKISTKNTLKTGFITLTYEKYNYFDWCEWSGKSTLGKALSEKLGILFIDGDDFHSLDNIEKMKKSIPLNDKDRKPWLIKLSKKIFESHKNGLLWPVRTKRKVP